MWAHPIFLIGVGVVTLVTVAAVAYTHYRYQQQHNPYENEEPRILEFERRWLSLPVRITLSLILDTTAVAEVKLFNDIDGYYRVLGPCGICRGAASVIDSWQAPCGHYLHYTCAANVARPSDSESSLNWDQVCMACAEQRIERNPRGETNKRLRNRLTNVQECANCLIRIRKEEPNTRAMVCGHLVHEECWERMQNSASATCPACMQA